MTQEICIAAFYKFAHFPDYRAWREPLLLICRAAGVRGTILLAEEGVNATIAGERAGIDRVLNFLRSDPRFCDLMIKESFHSAIPFQRLKVRQKREIVALKAGSVNPLAQVGRYVDPEHWNNLIKQDDVVLVDARNKYEVALGSFSGALNPQTDSFHELPRYLDKTLTPERHKRIAMFCTGGIRCEKATAYLLQRGFEQVFHLRGGILHYLESVAPADSLWQGECFVFDERVSLGHDLAKGRITICDDCKAVASRLDEACPSCGSASLL
ncbi:MAG: rhodanese-related sulfurtransferase [Chloroflexi bacterium]|nr:rhodanese-related sulfurtransferase [Chloroflexota bacterium]